MSNNRLDTTKQGKRTCPNCKKPNKFRVYRSDESTELYTTNGDLCGICDRVNECGHHVKPDGTVSVSEKSTKPNEQPTIKYVEVAPAKQDLFKKFINDGSSNFHQYCKSIQIPPVHLKKWGVGTDGDKTAFVFIDVRRMAVNLKYFKYSVAGSRDKTFTTYSLKGYTEGDQEYKYKVCLFGEHLLGTDKTKLVIIVESEKSAVIAHNFYQKYDWVSCASAEGLTDVKAEVLKGRTVIWLCDADKAGRDNSSMKTLKRNKIKHKIVDLFPERNDGYDIADAIRDGLRPEIEKEINAAEFQALAKSTKQGDIFSGLKTEKRLGASDSSVDLEVVVPKSEAFSEEQLHSISFTETGITYFAGGKAGLKRVANGFHVLIKYQNKDENDKVYWLLEILDLNIDEERRKKPITMEFTSEQFNSARYWKSEISKYALSFKVDDTILTELVEFLFLYRKFNYATRVLRYGWHEKSNTFLFANCGYDGHDIIMPDENGMLQIGDNHISLPQLKTSNNLNFFWTNTTFSFNQWFELYCKAYPKEGFIIANHYIMSLFLDIHQKHGKKNPILYIKGKPNSGKTTAIEVLSHNYGYKQNKTSLKSNPTPRAVAKLLNQTQNGFLHCDEFKNGMAYTDTFISAFDFEGFERSTDDAASGNETESFPVTRGIVITSNDEPTYEPFISRLIYLVKDDISKTEAETKAFMELDKWLKQGLACVSVELLKYRQLIDDNYKTCFSELQAYIKGLTTDLVDVETRNYSKTTQTLVIGYMLSKFGKISMVEPKEEKDILLEFATLGSNQLRFQHRLAEAKTALHQFFELFQSLYDQKRVFEGSHFRIDDGKLTMNLNSFYPIYQKEFFMINKENPQSKNEIFESLEKFDPEAQYKTSVRFSNIEEGQFSKTMAVKGCLSVSYQKLKDVFGLNLDINNNFYSANF